MYHGTHLVEHQMCSVIINEFIRFVFNRNRNGYNFCVRGVCVWVCSCGG